MEAYLCCNVDEFLQLSKEYRESEPFITSVITSAGNSVAAGRVSSENSFWWVVRENGLVKGCAMKTPPYGYVVSRLSESGSRVLADQILLKDPNFLDINGEKETILTLNSLLGKEKLEYKRDCMFMYKLTTLIEPNLKSGHAVAAEESDYEIAVEWAKQFAIDADVAVHGIEKIVETSISRGLLYFWVENGEKVSMAAHTSLIAGTSQNFVRLSLVYTPSSARGNGYASGLVAYVCRTLLQQNILPTLFADAANPISNKIYIKLGFEYLFESVKIHYSA